MSLQTENQNSRLPKSDSKRWSLDSSRPDCMNSAFKSPSWLGAQPGVGGPLSLPSSPDTRIPDLGERLVVSEHRRAWEHDETPVSLAAWLPLTKATPLPESLLLGIKTAGVHRGPRCQAQHFIFGSLTEPSQLALRRGISLMLLMLTEEMKQTEMNLLGVTQLPHSGAQGYRYD